MSEPDRELDDDAAREAISNAFRHLPLAGKLKGVNVICPHEPACRDAEACVKRTVEYTTGRRATP